MPRCPTYIGGEILPECRGSEAVLISRYKGELGGSVYPVSSPEFVHLTGVMTVTNPLERVYIGLHVDAANRVVREVSLDDRDSAGTLFSRTDMMVVHPHFLIREKPEEVEVPFS